MNARVSLLGMLLLAWPAGCATNGDVTADESDATPVVGRVATGQARSADKPGAAASLAATVGIPVLVFHEICAAECTAADTYGVSKDEFDAILTVLDTRGYHAISIADFARARQGDTSGLPERPVLITFDDGRQDAYVGADPILAKHAMQATMFVITNGPSGTPDFYMSWSEIQSAATSGRWTMQLHAHAGHIEMTTGIAGNGQPALGSFYGNLECEGGDTCPSYEAHDGWRRRVETDLETGDAILAAKLGELYTSHSFAVPYGDFGQHGTNDERIPEELRLYFDASFAVWFTQPSDDPPFMWATRATHEAARYRLTNELGADDVAAWLSRHEAR